MLKALQHLSESLFKLYRKIVFHVKHCVDYHPEKWYNDKGQERGNYKWEEL